MPACAQLPAGPLSRCSHVAVPFSSQVHWDRVWIARKVRGEKKVKNCKLTRQRVKKAAVMAKARASSTLVQQ